MIIRNSLAILRQISEIEERIEKELKKNKKEKRKATNALKGNQNTRLKKVA